MVESVIVPLLKDWAAGQPERMERVRQCFGLDGVPFDEELVLERYELLYEAGLVEEARFDGRPAALARDKLPQLGLSMRADNRRILATAISRLRGKLKYRPVIFELMPTGFTLTALQRTVEAISGPCCTSRISAVLWSRGPWWNPQARPLPQAGGQRRSSASAVR